MAMQVSASALQVVVSFIVLQACSAEVNLLYVHDSSSEKTAHEAIKIAFDYAYKHIPGFSGNFTEVLINGESQHANNEFCSKLSSMVSRNHPPSVILDDTRLEIGNDVIKRLTRRLQLPTISITLDDHLNGNEAWNNLTDDEAMTLIQVSPSTEVTTQIVPELVKTFNMTTVAILYDESTFGSTMKQKYINWFVNVPVSFVFRKIGKTIPDLAIRLKEMLTRGITTFFLLGSSEFMTRVLQAGNDSNMFIHSVSWYAVDVEDRFEATLPCRRPHCDIILIQPFTNQEESLKSHLQEQPKLKSMNVYETMFYFDLIVSLLMAMNNLQADDRWPPVQSSTCTGMAADRSNGLKLNLRKAMSEVPYVPAYGPFTFTANPIYQMTSHRIYKIEKSQSETQDNVLIGYWTPGNLSVLNANAFAQHLPQSVYRVVTFISPPFVYRNASANNSFYGYCIDLMNELKDFLNFEYIIYEADLERFVGIDGDQQFEDGLIGEVIKKNADIAVGALAIMAEREYYVDFTLPFYDLVGINLLMRKPVSAPSLFKFLTVLEGNVWGCILAAYFFTSLLLWLFDRFSPYSYQNNKEDYVDDDEKREFNLKECLWFCMTSLTPQGGGEAPKNLSGRLIAASWWLFGFIIIASYTANLAAFLTVSRLESSIGSLDDLANQYKIKYAPVNGSSAMTYFERRAYIEELFYQMWKRLSLNDSLTRKERAKLAVWDYPVSDKYSKMWEDMKESQMPNTFKEGVERVRNPGKEEFVLIAEANQVRYEVMTNCDFMAVGEDFSRKPYALAVQKGSPLKDELSLGILKLQSQRKLEAFKERWWSQNPDKKKCDEENNQSEGISIRNIGGVFIVILIGIVLAGLMLIAEYFWYQVYKGSSRRIGPSVTRPSQPIRVAPTTSPPKRTLPPRRCAERNRSYYYGF